MSMKVLYPSQVEAQRAISKAVHTNPLYVMGDVPIEKWERLVEKFVVRYEVDISPAARQHRKRKGRCSSRLIGARLPPDASGREKIRWVLLVTRSGKGAVKEQEALQDAHKDRITWGDYVLMHLTRPRKHGGGSRWTWCLAPQVEKLEANYVTALAQAAGRSGDPSRMRSYLKGSLLRRPMHSGVRTQVAKMLRRAKRVWLKHSNGQPWPASSPDNLPWLGTFKAQTDQP
ncbi:hypothetical protein LV476_01975 [Guyparkeria hydrothermalis]|uniref:hypothetical protein n=1 Tax=Guyparkeria hydrothermalis TaxID=923 RepID=UPI002020BC62|nr:hypothetical protein [Guyparkeria hydrothermalis]MCL7743720.1 hypothetical protein [Guyparkeria hydrothermalis]